MYRDKGIKEFSWLLKTAKELYKTSTGTGEEKVGKMGKGQFCEPHYS